MATYLWSSLSNGDIIAFDPATDVLRFDDPGIPAAQITGDLYFDPFFLIYGFVVTDWYRAVLLLNITDQRVFTQTNFTFADGSVLLNGDNTIGTVNDDGPNTLMGGAGSDQLAGYGGSDSLVGGPGNDLLNGGAGNDTLIGGPGNDQIFDDGGINSIEGGDGNDFFLVADTQYIGQSTITGGAGRDEYLPVFFTNGFYTAPTPVVLDFQPGAGGDRINLAALLLEAFYSAYYFFQNPFDPTIGFIQFYQYGPDTYLLFDPDTPYYPGYGYQVVLTLKNVSVSQLTVADNISLFTAGTNSDDNLAGGSDRDFLYGGAGNDTLNGGPGADTLAGGAGADTYFVDDAKDVVAEEAAGALAALFGVPGPEASPPPATVAPSAISDLIDTVIAAVSYSLENVKSVENITLANTGSGGRGTTAFGNELANLITGNELDNFLDGLGGDDTLNGGAGGDTLRGGAGNDTLDGGSGADTAVYSDNRAAHTITKTTSGYTVSGREGSDTLSNVERLQFSDKKVALDLGSGEVAGNTVRIIGAAFDAPVIQQHPDYVGIGLRLFDSGMSMQQVCQLAIGAMGSPSNVAFVTTVYTNVVGVAPSADVRDSFVGLLQGSGGTMTQADLLVLAANADVNAVNINLVGLQQSGVEFV